LEFLELQKEKKLFVKKGNNLRETLSKDSPKKPGAKNG
tara:strand:+ start:660 stop:773 length:114 start_codon:yes stop_codon:yes gene_type:complete